MYTAQKLKEYNANYRDASPSEIINFALGSAQRPIVTTNFRPYEVAILHAITLLRQDIPVVWCDSGYNTLATYKHADQLIERLQLDIHLYVPLQTAAYRNAIMGIPDINDERHALFTEQVKLEPFKRAMEAHDPDVWFTNLRFGQTALRDSLDIFSISKTGVLKVSPFYHYSDEDLDAYLEQHSLPNELNYYDPTKVLSHRECGIHL